MIEDGMQEGAFVSIKDRWKACEAEASKRSSTSNTAESVGATQAASALALARKWQSMSVVDPPKNFSQHQQAPVVAWMSATCSTLMIIPPPEPASTAKSPHNSRNAVELKRATTLTETAPPGSLSTKLSPDVLGRRRFSVDAMNPDTFVAGWSTKSVQNEYKWGSNMRKDPKYSPQSEDSSWYQHTVSPAMLRIGRASLSADPQGKVLDDRNIPLFSRTSLDSSALPDLASSIRKFDSMLRETSLMETESSNISLVTRNVTKQVPPFSTAPATMPGSFTRDIPRGNKTVEEALQFSRNSIPLIEHVSLKPVEQKEVAKAPSPLLVPRGPDSMESANLPIGVVVSSIEKSIQLAEPKPSVKSATLLSPSSKKGSTTSETKWKQAKSVDTSSCRSNSSGGFIHHLKPVNRSAEDERGIGADTKKRNTEVEASFQSVISALKKVDPPMEEKWKKRNTGAQDEVVSYDGRPSSGITMEKNLEGVHAKSAATFEFPKRLTSEIAKPNAWLAPEKRPATIESTGSLSKVSGNVVVPPIKRSKSVDPKRQAEHSPNEVASEIEKPNAWLAPEKRPAKIESTGSLSKLSGNGVVPPTKRSKSVDPKRPSQQSPRSHQQGNQGQSTSSFRHSSTSLELEALRSLGLTKKVTLKSSVSIAPPLRRDNSNQTEELSVKELAKTFSAKATILSSTMNQTRLESKVAGNDKLSSAIATSIRAAVSRGRARLSNATKLDQVKISLLAPSKQSKETARLDSHESATQVSDPLTNEPVPKENNSAMEELEHIRSLGRTRTFSLNQPKHNKTSSLSRNPLVLVTSDNKTDCDEANGVEIQSTKIRSRACNVGRAMSRHAPLALETVPSSCNLSNREDAPSITSLPNDLDGSKSFGSLRPSSSSRWERYSPSNFTSRSLDTALNDDLAPVMSMDSEYTTETQLDGGDHSRRDNRYIQISLSSGGVAEKYEPNIVVSPTAESSDSEDMLTLSPAGSLPGTYDVRESRRRKSREPFKGAKRFFFGNKKK